MQLVEANQTYGINNELPFKTIFQVIDNKYNVRATSTSSNNSQVYYFQYLKMNYLIKCSL